MNADVGDAVSIYADFVKTSHLSTVRGLHELGERLGQTTRRMDDICMSQSTYDQIGEVWSLVKKPLIRVEQERRCQWKLHARRMGKELCTTAYHSFMGDRYES